MKVVDELKRSAFARQYPDAGSMVARSVEFIADRCAVELGRHHCHTMVIYAKAKTMPTNRMIFGSVRLGGSDGLSPHNSVLRCECMASAWVCHLRTCKDERHVRASPLLTVPISGPPSLWPEPAGPLGLVEGSHEFYC